MKKNIYILICILMVMARGSIAQVENTEYTNPIIPADYSDPDVIRVGDDYYMTSSSFNIVPGLPILHSKDLVHWTLIGHGLQSLPDALFTYKNRKATELDYNLPRVGKGVYAPSIRHHDGYFWIYWGDPDAGIYMIKTKDPAGTWSDPVLVHQASGIIDPCPHWDEKTGKAYLSHAYAKSRANFNSRIDVWEMSPDGTRLIGWPITVFDAFDKEKFAADRFHEIIEGTKFMQRGEWYYILCPAGSVELGWQTVLRSKNPLGPYEIRTVCETGTTNINGPHQGALFDTPDGEWWFIHFQSAGTLGRIVWLEPAEWKDGWPVIGVDPDGDGLGIPVHSYKAPLPFVPKAIQMSDDFSEKQLGLQWQWPANPKKDWAKLKKGKLILPAQLNAGAPLPNVPSVLTQMFPDYKFSATAKMELKAKHPDVRAGLASMGRKSFDIGIQKDGENSTVSVRYQNTELASATLPSGEIWLRLEVAGEPPLPLLLGRKVKGLVGTPDKVEDLDRTKNGLMTGQFSYSSDGVAFTKLGDSFEVRTGTWIGARTGLYCLKSEAASKGQLEVDSFEIRR